MKQKVVIRVIEQFTRLVQLYILHMAQQKQVILLAQKQIIGPF